MDTKLLLEAALASPKDGGTLRRIVLRKPDKKHLTPDKAAITVAGGVEGDRWGLKPDPDPSFFAKASKGRGPAKLLLSEADPSFFAKASKGRGPAKLLLSEADPSMQVSLINARFIDAAGGSPERAALSGDNLAVDLDLGFENLPVGARLRVGAAVLEITDHPHKGCSLFERHYGKPARDLVDSTRGRALRLRGAYARVVTGGEVKLGDAVNKEG